MLCMITGEEKEGINDMQRFDMEDISKRVEVMALHIICMFDNRQETVIEADRLVAFDGEEYLGHKEYESCIQKAFWAEGW